MRQLFTCLAFVLAVGPAAAQEGAAPGLDCSSGPLAKTYGAHPWLVYACSDDKSLVVVATEENPARPFFFKLFLKDGARFVVGEGSGKQAVTAPAYEELTKLGEDDIAALATAARASRIAPAKP